jgi:putative ABC transport system ATP-binding protein
MNDKKKSYIRFQNVSKTYFTPAGDVPALNNLNFEIQRASFVGIIGKSGAGKSTLVNMLTAVDNLTRGELWVENTPLHNLSQDQLTRWRGENVGVIYQSFELLNQLSLLENVMLPMDLCGKFIPFESPKRAKQLLEQVEIGDHAKKTPDLISGGQRQRVAIARALANDPDLIVADEPTGSLDSQTSEVIFQIFQDLVNRGKTVVMVTHDHNLVSRFDHLLFLEDGEVIKEKKRGKNG